MPVSLFADPVVPSPARPEAHLLEPFWSSPVVLGESLLFVQEKAGERPVAHLLYESIGQVLLRSASGEITYEAGKDYQVFAQTHTVTLPEGSRIPYVTAAQLNPPPGSPNSMSGNVDGVNNLLWSEGHYFHDLEVEISYLRYKGVWEGYQPELATKNLAGTLGKLKRKEPLNLVVLGDSISAGYNASGFIGVPPRMPPYADLVRTNLQSFYGSQVSLTNLAVAGKTAEWGLTQTSAVIAARPDLVILAFGMNDSGGFEPAAYLANIKKIVDDVRAQSPKTEFILVASMLPNANWKAVRPERFPLYRDALQTLVGPGIALADMTSVWTEVTARKKYLDLTGNGLNHPNDFGHRLYAQVILGLLVKK